MGNTKRRSWLRAGPCAIATLILVLSGCVKIKPPERLPWPPSEDLRSRLGRVGMTATASTPVVEISDPARSRGQGALRGMLHQEFERALTSLAEKIVEEVFLLAPGP